MNESAALSFLKVNHKIGDILTLQVGEDFDPSQIENPRRALVSLVLPDTQYQKSTSQFHSTLMNSLGDKNHS